MSCNFSQYIWASREVCRPDGLSWRMMRSASLGLFSKKPSSTPTFQTANQSLFDFQARFNRMGPCWYWMPSPAWLMLPVNPAMPFWDCRQRRCWTSTSAIFLAKASLLTLQNGDVSPLALMTRNGREFSVRAHSNTNGQVLMDIEPVGDATLSGNLL